MAELKEYVLGSGHLHIEEFDELPEDDFKAFFESAENLIGRIKGGASLEYTTEKFEDQDDLGYVVIEEVTKETVNLKSGVMTWDGETLEKICSTARVSKDEKTGVVTVKIGGLANQNDKKWVVGFEHKSKKLRVIIIGRNHEGFTFSFTPDSTTVIDTTFRAEALLDDEGTLVIIQDFRKANKEALEELSAKSKSQIPTESKSGFSEDE